MTDGCDPQHAVGTADLTLTVPAEAIAAGEASRQVGEWLERSVHPGAERASDIVLAAYEALANCADHAYRNHDGPGPMTVEAAYDIDTSTVRLCVTDHGRWVDPHSRPADIARGRGLRLMKALCDDFSVNGAESGTTVCLDFENCVRCAVAPQV